MRKLEIKKEPCQPEMDPNMKKIIVVLTGGGAKGAFQVGAWSRIIQEGLNFEGENQKIVIPLAVFGVGVGKFNGEMIALGKTKDLVKTWNRIAEKCGGSDTFKSILLDGDESSCNCNPNPLQQAIKYALQLDGKEEIYFVIISTHQDCNSVDPDIDLSHFLRINKLVKQAEEKGLHLYSFSGRILKKFQFKVIQPQKAICTPLNYSRSLVMDTYLHGYDIAKTVIDSPKWD